MKRHVVCAAIRFGSCPQIVILGARHWDKLMVKQFEDIDERYHYSDLFKRDTEEQGFIDQYGVFLSRVEAMEVIKESGQPFDIKRNGGSDDELYSEGLY